MSVTPQMFACVVCCLRGFRCLCMRSMFRCMCANGIIMHSSLVLLFIILMSFSETRMNTNNLYATSLWARIYSNCLFAFVFDGIVDSRCFGLSESSRATASPCLYLHTMCTFKYLCICVHVCVPHICYARTRVRVCRLFMYFTLSSYVHPYQ